MEYTDLLQRVLPHLKGKKVLTGKERMEDMIRLNEAGLVWLSEDLAKNTRKKIIVNCVNKGIPVIVMGTSEELQESIYIENVKVLTLRKSFPGIAHLIDQLQDEIYTA